MSEKTETKPLEQPVVISRFFFFTYSYWRGKTEGKGNLSLTSKNGFPTHKNIKQLALEQVMSNYSNSNSEIQIEIVIDNWIEMSEEDFNRWVS